MSGQAYWRPDWERKWRPYRGVICAGHPRMPFASYCFICERDLPAEAPR